MDAPSFIIVIRKSTFILAAVRQSLIELAPKLSDKDRSDIARKFDELGREFLAMADEIRDIPHGCQTMIMKLNADREQSERHVEILPTFDTP